MTTFDVFVNGIQANRLPEYEKIKQAVAEQLKINTKKAEQVLNTASSTRILKAVSEKIAQQSQKDLQALGVVCLYRPSAQSAKDLSLLNLDSAKKKKLTANCPNCDLAFPSGIEHHPEKCDGCGVFIEKFLRIQKLDAEREKQRREEKEKIKKQLLQRKAIQDALEKENREQLAEAKRKKQLEAEIKKELALKRKYRPWAIVSGVAAALVVVSTSVGAYMYFKPEGGYAYFRPEEWFSPSEAVIEEFVASNEGENLALSSPDGDNLVAVTESSISDSVDTTVMTDIEANADINTGCGQGISLQEADQAFDKLGVKSNAFTAKASDSASAPINSAAHTALLGGQNSKNSAAVKSIATNGSTASTAIANITSPAFLLNNSLNAQAWDHFLAQKIRTKTTVNKELSAYYLSRHITDTKTYIKSSGRLLVLTGQAKIKIDIYADIEARINLLSPQQQIEALSLASFYQYKADKDSRYLEQASQLAKSLTEPKEQLAANLQLGVAYARLGQMKAANQNFSKVNGLLAKIPNADTNVQSRIAVAKAYKDARSDSNAEQWLLSTKKRLTSVSSSVYTEVIMAYAYLGDTNNALAMIQQSSGQFTENELLLQAIQISVRKGDYESAAALQLNINEPSYKAASYILMARDTKHNADYLASTETLLNNEIKRPLDKAVISSYLALQYAIYGNKTKTKKLYPETKKELSSIPTSSKKDDAVAIVATNYAHTLHVAYAKDLLGLAQSASVKATVQAEISKANQVAQLVN